MAVHAIMMPVRLARRRNLAPAVGGVELRCAGLTVAVNPLYGCTVFEAWAAGCLGASLNRGHTPAPSPSLGWAAQPARLSGVRHAATQREAAHSWHAAKKCVAHRAPTARGAAHTVV